MDLEGIYQRDQAVIEKLDIDLFPDELGLELCENWKELKKLISINWRYYISSQREFSDEISEIKNKAKIQLLVDWVCNQYIYYKSLSDKERMIIEDKIIGILNPNMDEALNQIINDSPQLHISLVLQTPERLKEGNLAESLRTILDPSKTFQKLKEKKLSFIQLQKGSHCLITFPIFDVLIPNNTRIYHVETKKINFILGDEKMELDTGFYTNLIDLELIPKFCEDLNQEIYSLFSEETKNLWKIICKWCIKKGKGDLELSKKILNLEK